MQGETFPVQLKDPTIKTEPLFGDPSCKTGSLRAVVECEPTAVIKVSETKAG